MRPAWLGFGLFALAGCVSPEQQASQDIQSCLAMGIGPDSRLMLQCRLQQQQARITHQRSLALVASQEFTRAQQRNSPTPIAQCTSRANIFGGQDVSCF